jgi:hypothetical protein
MGIPVPVRRSSLFGLLLISCCCVTFAFVPDEGSPQAPSQIAPAHRTLEQAGLSVAEADFREAIHQVEELAKGLETGPKTYREHLHTALYKLGYGLHHPLFRTSLNGFEQDQIDLEDADEYKMGSFAFSVRSAGQVLSPDPFDDWVGVQQRIDSFEPTMDSARRAVARTGTIAFNSAGNIPLEVFHKLNNRWRAAVVQATEAYEHALAIRAVLYSDGEMVPAPQSFKFLYDSGRYAVVCVFGACTSKPAASESDEVRGVPGPR